MRPAQCTVFALNIFRKCISSNSFYSSADTESGRYFCWKEAKRVGAERKSNGAIVRASSSLLSSWQNVHCELHPTPWKNRNGNNAIGDGATEKVSNGLQSPPRSRGCHVTLYSPPSSSYPLILVSCGYIYPSTTFQPWLDLLRREKWRRIVPSAPRLNFRYGRLQVSSPGHFCW